MTLELVFWVAAALLAYTFVGYPLLIALLAYLRPRRVARAPIRPTVSLVIVAHNEAAVIRHKLENCLALEYPADKLEVVLASDGSTDGTADIAREFTRRGVSAPAGAERPPC
jgi:cellulose synthase/poly-beta-1,6-N-acetylglucosamine synthase-like glycosyltransferase